MMRIWILACVAALLLAWVALAGGATAWETNTYDDFQKGRLAGLALTRDGRLRLAPKLETVFRSEEPVIWSLVQAADGALFAGTGHRGRLYRVDPSGKSEVFWTADQPEIFALALDRHGALLAATSPDGKVYKLEGGKAAEYFAPGTRYIWSLAVSADGSLFVGTGDEGKIFRVDPQGKAELYYDTGQSHVTCLAFDAAGRLLAGTEPNGILYRISARDQAFVLYDADLPEIRRLRTQPDGTVYAVALGGSLTRKPLPSATPGTAPQPVAPTASVTVTVTEEDLAQGGVEIKPKEDPSRAPAAVAPAAPPASPLFEMAGVERSALYRIHPDNLVEKLWSSTEENAFDVLIGEHETLLATDRQGRIYGLGSDQRVRLVAQTDESEAVSLVAVSGGLLVATSNMGRVFRLGEGSGAEGSYESLVHDAGAVARWGQLSWRAELPEASRLVFRTRSGNSARPDRTWSEWSQPLADAAGSAVSSPNARFIQWKAEFAGNGGRSPELDSVRLAYLPQNAPPRVLSVTVDALSAPRQAQKGAQAAPAASPYSITVTDTGQAGAATAAGTATQALSRLLEEQIQISWQAEDTDGDELTYSVYFRGDGEREWKLLKRDLRTNTLAAEADAFADGRYFFRVTASDRAANPLESAREAEHISAPVWIDRTPPTVTATASARSENQVEISAEARDAASPLTRCEYSVDAGAWNLAAAVDGVIDGLSERFQIRLDNLPAGERLVVIRVFDSAGNAGLARLVLR